MVNTTPSITDRFVEFPRRGMRWLYQSSPAVLQSLFLRMKPLQGVGLAMAFALAFALPVFLFYQGINFLWPHEITGEESKDRFPRAVRFGYQGAYGKVYNDPALSPSIDKPWLFSAWFKISQLPTVGQRILLAAKFNPDSRVAEGFGLGLLRDRVGIRPVVYWRASNGAGGWHQFSKFQIREGEWFLLSLSFREGRLLGLHGVANPGEEGKGVELLGGYELDPVVIPINTNDLVFGAYGENHFRGFVGPFSIFSGPGIGDDISGIVKRLAKNPDQLPDLVSSDALVVRGYLGEQLITPLNIRSEVVKPVRNRKKAASDTSVESER